MSKILAILNKEIKLKFSSPLEWLYFLILPVFFTVILAGGTGAPSDSRIRLLVADQANSPLSAQLLNLLENSTAVRPDLMPLDRAEREFKQQNAAALLIIPAQFSDQNLASGTVSLDLRELPNSLNALAAYQGVAAAVNRLGSLVEIANASAAEAEKYKLFLSSSSLADYKAEALRQAQVEMANAPSRLKVVEATTPDTIQYDPRANSSAGQLITWVFIPLFGLSVIFTAERQKGTLRRVLTTPTSKATYLFGVIFSHSLIAAVQMALLILFGTFVMKLNWTQSPGALALIVCSSILAAAAIGTTLGTFVKSEAQGNMLSIMLGMVMALLGGCWYPIELFPRAVQTASFILPTRWAIQGMLDIVLRGKGFTAVLPEAGVLLGFALLFFILGIWRCKYE